MRIQVLPDLDEIGRAGADLVVEALTGRPDPMLGVATGSSPEPVYRALAARVEQGLDLRHVDVVALDEYLGLPPGHPQSYAQVVARTVAEPLGLDPRRVRVPDAQAADPDAAARAFDDLVRARAGADIQVLGLGHNGHIAFNEPGASPDSRTRVVELSASTRQANARFFGGDCAAVPTRAITQGVATILSARQVLLVVTGLGKARAVAAALTGPRTPDCPGSALQQHPRLSVLLDPDAASRLAHGTASVSPLGPAGSVGPVGSVGRLRTAGDRPPGGPPVGGP